MKRSRCVAKVSSSATLSRGLHVVQPVHRQVARVDLAIRGERAYTLHRSVIHAEEDHRVIRRFQVDDAGLVPAVAHVVASQLTLVDGTLYAIHAGWGCAVTSGRNVCSRPAAGGPRIELAR